MEIMHCWPTKWIDAAVEAGLCKEVGQGRYEYIFSQDVVNKVAKFAELITGE